MRRGSAPPNDYWATEFAPGAAARWEFSGTTGLERLTGPSRIEAAPDGFEARLTRIQLDHVAIEVLQASPHSAVRGPAEIEAHPTELLTFLLLADGELHVRTDDRAYELQAGECVLIDSRIPFGYRAPRPVRMLRSVVGIEHLPLTLRERATATTGPLQRTPLVESFIAFVSTLLRTTAAGHRAQGQHLIRSLADLQSAVVAEAQHQALPLGPAGLRHRMEEHIQQHYADPDLGPATIASAFGISLRHAHNVFDEGDRTIARFIADRRIATVAEELRTSSDRIRLGDMARRHGFTSPDTLSRAFKRRFGMTPTEYREGGHRSYA